LLGGGANDPHQWGRNREPAGGRGRNEEKTNKNGRKKEENQDNNPPDCGCVVSCDCFVFVCLVFFLQCVISGWGKKTPKARRGGGVEGLLFVVCRKATKNQEIKRKPEVPFFLVFFVCTRGGGGGIVPGGGGGGSPDGGGGATDATGELLGTKSLGWFLWKGAGGGAGNRGLNTKKLFFFLRGGCFCTMVLGGGGGGPPPFVVRRGAAQFWRAHGTTNMFAPRRQVQTKRGGGVWGTSTFGFFCSQGDGATVGCFLVKKKKKCAQKKKDGGEGGEFEGVLFPAARGFFTISGKKNKKIGGGRGEGMGFGGGVLVWFFTGPHKKRSFFFFWFVFNEGGGEWRKGGRRA